VRRQHAGFQARQVEQLADQATQALRLVAQVIPLYRDDPDLVRTLTADADGLREVLVQAIAQNHPEGPFDIIDEQYGACRRFLANFSITYTLNYDLLLCWAVMHTELEPAIKSDDGFRTPEDSAADYVTWEVENTDRQNIFYLHGALHVFDAEHELKKYTWINTGIRLIEQIRAAYRVLAKQNHPDVNHGSRNAMARTQAINAAYKTLRDPARRRAYDGELASAKKIPAQKRSGKSAVNLAKEIYLGIQDFLRGTKLEVRVNDPANPNGAEIYELIVPPATAPRTRFRLPRIAPFEHGFVLARVKARPDFRFKVRGSDLRCDLKISSQRALQGGTESVRSVTGNFLRVQIPKKVSRGEIIRITGEGLPKPRGGRGDLLVRIIYRPEVRITRASAR